ncbi:MAG: flagellar capping protein [Lachnospiraceae bacterium]|nr:flagellar capping protein [Lachnospiraceae bacterium]
MSNSILNATYAEISSIYGKSLGSTKYDSHKKDELQTTVKNILKVNKDSPLYRVHYTEKIRDYALDIKKGALIIQNVVASLSETSDGVEGISRSKIAYSSNPEVADVTYNGYDNEDSLSSSSFNLEVLSLATPQVNTGKFLNSNGHDFKPGTYSFSINTSGTSFDFQFDVTRQDNNKVVLNRLSKLINSLHLGVNSEVIDSDNRTSALQLESEKTGVHDSNDMPFAVSPKTDEASLNMMDLLGIDKVTSPAENARFYLNGVPHQSFSNNFTVNNSFAVTLNGVSPEHKPLTIGFKPGFEAVADGVNALASSYNNMIEATNQYPDELPSKLLRSNISSVANAFGEELETAGLTLGEDLTLTFDKTKLIDTLKTSSHKQVYDTLNRFKDALGRKATMASLDPMAYVDKKVVAYKDPDKSFYTPYITSIYSGMMFDIQS